MSAICSRCSLSSSTTTTMIDLSARWICKRRYPADQSRMASLLLERFSADFITRTAGPHDRCTFAALHLLLGGFPVLKKKTTSFYLYSAQGTRRCHRVSG